MRLFSITLAFYIMALSLLPCDHILRKYNSDHISHMMDHKEHADSNYRDHCSPFCMCTCCGMSIVPAQLPPWVMDNTIIHGYFAILTFEKLVPFSHFYENVWHPPKMIV